MNQSAARRMACAIKKTAVPPAAARRRHRQSLIVAPASSLSLSLACFKCHSPRLIQATIRQRTRQVTDGQRQTEVLRWRWSHLCAFAALLVLFQLSRFTFTC
jgi:hypothetical protein